MLFGKRFGIPLFQSNRYPSRLLGFASHRCEIRSRGAAYFVKQEYPVAARQNEEWWNFTPCFLVRGLVSHFFKATDIPRDSWASLPTAAKSAAVGLPIS